MKALIRNNEETVTESMGIDGINWNTGAPLTNPDWCGGPYRLVADYVEDVVTVDTPTVTKVIEEPDENIDDGKETITLSADDIALLRRVIG